MSGDRAPTARIARDQVVWRLDDGTEQRIPLADILVVGEYTDVGGAYIEDYWLMVVLRDGQTWSLGSEDPSSSAFYAELGVALTGAAFTYGLCNQCTFVSRILWPTEHLDASLMEACDGQPTWSVVTRKLLADGGYPG